MEAVDGECVCVCVWFARDVLTYTCILKKLEGARVRRQTLLCVVKRELNLS